MKSYKTRWFDRWARKQGLNNLGLCLAVREMMEGLYEADLGGGLSKNELHELDRVKVEVFGHWLLQIKAIAGFLYLVLLWFC